MFTVLQCQIYESDQLDLFQISCLDCSVETGKIAAAYNDRVVIFEPTPLRPVGAGEEGHFDLLLLFNFIFYLLW